MTGKPNYPGGKFYSGYSFFGKSYEQIYGAKVYRVPHTARGKGGKLGLLLNYFSFVISSCLAVIFKVKGPFDAVFVFQTSPITVAIPAILAKRRFKSRLFLWVLDIWPDSIEAVGAVKSKVVLGLVGKLVSWIYHNCDYILISSKNFRAKVQQYSKTPYKIKYFPNWVEEDFVIETISRQKLNKNKFKIMYAGNIGEAQDFPNLLKVIESIKQVRGGIHWQIVGSGRLEGWVRKEVQRRNLNSDIQFFGQLPASETARLLQSADILFLSLRNEDIFKLTAPGKIQSYLAAGKPIVGMLSGEGAEILLESGSGFVAEAGQVDLVVDIITQLFEFSEEKRRQLGRKGILFAQNCFSRDKLFEQLDGWLKNSVNKKEDAQNYECL